MGRSLLRSTFTVSGMTFLSRILGFVRDVVFATVFGAGAATDAFFVAFKIPNFLRRLFAEGAFSQAFVPVLSEYKTQRGQEEVKALIASVSGALGLVLLAITAVVVVASPWVTAIFAPGWAFDEPQKYALAAEMLRVTFPYLLFISLTAFCGGILNSYGYFAVPAFTPVWLNVVMIGAAMIAASAAGLPDIRWLAWGVFIAGIVQLLFQLPTLLRLGLLSWPRWGWRHEGVRRILRLMGPAIFGSSVAQINLVLDTIIASFLITGSVSWLYYSDRLVEFPLGVFGIALATVILPSLSSQHAADDRETFSNTLDWALRWMLLISLPATLGLILLAGPLLATLFQHGAFGAEDVAMARLSLMAYGLGLVGFSLVKVLAPGFYARQDTATPVKIGIIAMVTNMMLNLLFVVPMVYLDVPGPHAGLALATAASAFINGGLLFRRLRRDGIYSPADGWGSFASKLLLANGMLVAMLLVFAGDLSWWTSAPLMEQVVRLSALVFGGVLLYFAALFSVGIRPHHLLGRRR